MGGLSSSPLPVATSKASCTLDRRKLLEGCFCRDLKPWKWSILPRARWLACLAWKENEVLFFPNSNSFGIFSHSKGFGAELLWTLYGYLGQIRLGLPKGSVLKGSLKVRWGQWEVFGEIFDEHSPQIYGTRKPGRISRTPSTFFQARFITSSVFEHRWSRTVGSICKCLWIFFTKKMLNNFWASNIGHYRVIMMLRRWSELKE